MFLSLCNMLDSTTSHPLSFFPPDSFTIFDIFLYIYIVPSLYVLPGSLSPFFVFHFLFFFSCVIIFFTFSLPLTVFLSPTDSPTFLFTRPVVFLSKSIFFTFAHFSQLSPPPSRFTHPHLLASPSTFIYFLTTLSPVELLLSSPPTALCPPHFPFSTLSCHLPYRPLALRLLLSRLSLRATASNPINIFFGDKH